MVMDSLKENSEGDDKPAFTVEEYKAVMAELMEETEKLRKELGDEIDSRRDTAEEDLEDYKEYALAAARTLPTLKRGYTPGKAPEVLEQYKEMLSIINAVHRRPEFRTLSRKALISLASLAETTSFMMDVGEFDWRDLVSLAGAAHTFQWTPLDQLDDDERAMLVRMLLAYGLSGRDLLVPLQMATYLKEMTEEELADIRAKVDASDVIGLRGMRMGFAILDKDMRALIEAFGGEPQNPDAVFNLILEILDHDMDEEVLVLAEAGLAMDPPDHLESVLQEIRNDILHGM